MCGETIHVNGVVHVLTVKVKTECVGGSVPGLPRSAAPRGAEGFELKVLWARRYVEKKDCT